MIEGRDFCSSTQQIKTLQCTKSRILYIKEKTLMRVHVNMIGLTFSVKYYNKETKKGGLFSPLKKNIHLGGECVVDVAFG